MADKTEDIINCPKFACIVQKVGDNTSEFDMGNILSFRGEKDTSRKCSILKPNEPVPDIPQIAVTEASPLPAAADGSMFTLPRYHSGPIHNGTPGQVDLCVRLSPDDSVDRHIESESVSLDVPHWTHEANQSNENEVNKHRTSRGSQCSSLSSHTLNDEADEGQFDSRSLSGSEGNNTPRVSRKNFIEHMMNSSPEVRRSMMLRNSIYLSTSCDHMSRSDSDTASLVSSNADEDGAAVTLDPLEHQWMMCASDGEWDSLHHLLSCEPNLILKKDFITGFTCLHWAAKQGKPELLALIVNFAKQHAMPIDINARSSAGYTPLHLAVMHNHMDVVKLLVGAYDADVEIRDYNGKMASQYLADSVAMDIRNIIGAYGDSDSENTDAGDGGHWRFSRVLHSNLKPRKLLHHNEHDSVDGAGHPRQKVRRSRSSLSMIKPKLQKIRFRTSQIVHSISFLETEELEGSSKASFKSKPKSNLFG